MSHITKQEVFTAANELADQGIMPSIMSVREAVGERGSETTINKHLKEWKLLLLKKNTVGCIFCDQAAKEAEILQAKLERYQELVDQLKDACITMIKNPDHKIAVDEVITRLQ